MDLSFERLSEKHLAESFRLLDLVFPNNAETAKTAYRASLNPNDEKWKTRRFLDYFNVIDKETSKIVALTGLYSWFEHPENEIWLGWFCVDPVVRGKGIGRRVLEWTIDEAQRRGFKYFKLWTSTDPAEAIAQKLYDSLDIKIYKREKSIEFEDEEILYRELLL